MFTAFPFSEWLGPGPIGVLFPSAMLPPLSPAFSFSRAGQQLMYHVLGTPQSEDVTVLADPDHPTWMFGTEVRPPAAPTHSSSSRCRCHLAWAAVPALGWEGQQRRWRGSACGSGELPA